MHFTEAMVTGHEWLVEQCKNHEKDRHVLACAIHCRADVITTFNVPDFPEDTLKQWNVTATHPQEELISLYDLHQQLALTIFHGHKTSQFNTGAADFEPVTASTRHVKAENATTPAATLRLARLQLCGDALPTDRLLEQTLASVLGSLRP